MDSSPAVITLAAMSLAMPPVLAEPPPYTAILELDNAMAAFGKPRIALLELCSLGSPRIAVIEFNSDEELAEARSGRATVDVRDRDGTLRCTFDGVTLCGPEGMPLLVVAADSVVYAPGVAEPIYSYAEHRLIDAAGVQSVLVADHGGTVGALELALAVARRVGYCG